MRGESKRQQIEKLMEEIGRAAREAGRVYFTGGVTAVLMGWREMTVDVDLKLEPEPVGIFDALPRLKEELEINIELASPDDFIPALEGWQGRSRFIARHGKVDFFHYDFYAQALAKIERWHTRDRGDVLAMIAGGLVERLRLTEFFDAIAQRLARYPAVDAEAFRSRVKAVAEEDEA